jgi:hypothetical protein
MKAVMVAAILLTLCGAIPVKAQNFTGNDMLPGCEAADAFVATGSVPRMSSDMAVKAGYCLGQMTTIMYFSQLMAIKAGNKPCIPEDTTSGQLVSSLVNYLRAHPEERNLSFMLLGLKATNRTCRK